MIVKIHLVALFILSEFSIEDHIFGETLWNSVYH